MIFTNYGKDLAQAEPHMPNPDNLTGASLHMLALKYDQGQTIMLTGRANGKPVRKSAKSVYGAWALAKAVWGVERAWHIRSDGTRKLIFRR